MTKKVTKEQVKNYLRYRLSTDKVWALSALMKIYDNQTKDEQNCGRTINHNDIGFTGADAEFFSSLAENYKKWGRLTPKQMMFVFKGIKKYWNQILSISDEELLKQQTAMAIQKGVKF